MPFEGWAARAALHSRVDREMPKSAPIPVSTANLVAGAKIYKDQCWGCHGLRGEEQTESAQAMFPKPPHLLRGKGVTDDSPGETYWKTANGIRLSGMPAFKKVLSEQEIWQVSLFLANANKLPPEAETIVQGGKTRRSSAQNSRETTPFRATLELSRSANLRNCCVLNFPRLAV